MAEPFLLTFMQENDQLPELREKKRFHLNIGIVIFGALFIYLVISVVIYLTTDRTQTVQVTAGSLSKDESCTALVLRNETVVYADRSGYVSYFIEDGAKAGKLSAVCAVSETPLEKSSQDASGTAPEEMRLIAGRYANAYDPDRFDAVYDLKFSLQTAATGLPDPSRAGSDVLYAEEDGILTYSSDGYESKTPDTVLDSDFQAKALHKKQMKSDARVESGDPLYRLITSDTWSVVFPMTESLTPILEDQGQIQVRFRKDAQTETGQVRLYETEGRQYAQITFSSGMVRYCSDRYLEIDLLTNSRSGLKIPASSVVEKSFFTIPAVYATSGGENGEMGFLKETTDSDGNTTTVFTEATIYEHLIPGENSDEGTEEVYYVDNDSFRKGDKIILPESDLRYEIGPSAALKGVYCTNKGYAVFRKISILDENDELCIVAPGTSYGIAQYDFIVRDGYSVNEEQIIHPE